MQLSGLMMEEEEEDGVAKGRKLVPRSSSSQQGPRSESVPQERDLFQDLLQAAALLCDSPHEVVTQPLKTPQYDTQSTVTQPSATQRYDTQSFVSQSLDSRSQPSTNRQYDTQSTITQISATRQYDTQSLVTLPSATRRYDTQSLVTQSSETQSFATQHHNTQSLVTQSFDSRSQLSTTQRYDTQSLVTLPSATRQYDTHSLVTQSIDSRSQLLKTHRYETQPSVTLPSAGHRYNTQSMASPKLHSRSHRSASPQYDTQSLVSHRYESQSLVTRSSDSQSSATSQQYDRHGDGGSPPAVQKSSSVTSSSSDSPSVPPVILNNDPATASPPPALNRNSGAEHIRESICKISNGAADLRYVPSGSSAAAPESKKTIPRRRHKDTELSSSTVRSHSFSTVPEEIELNHDRDNSMGLSLDQEWSKPELSQETGSVLRQGYEQQSRKLEVQDVSDSASISSSARKSSGEVVLLESESEFNSSNCNDGLTESLDQLEGAVVTVEQAEGSVTVEVSQEATNVKQEEVAVSVEQTKGAVTVEQAERAVTVEQKQGAVTVKRTEGAITVEQTQGAVTVEQTERAVTVEQTQRAVTVEQTDGAITVKQTQGAVTVEETEKAIIVEQSGGAVTVEQSRGAVTVERSQEATAIIETQYACCLIQGSENGSEMRDTSPTHSEHSKIDDALKNSRRENVAEDRAQCFNHSNNKENLVRKCSVVLIREDHSVLKRKERLSNKQPSKPVSSTQKIPSAQKKIKTVNRRKTSLKENLGGSKSVQDCFVVLIDNGTENRMRHPNRTSSKQTASKKKVLHGSNKSTQPVIKSKGNGCRQLKDCYVRLSLDKPSDLSDGKGSFRGEPFSKLFTTRSRMLSPPRRNKASGVEGPSGAAAPAIQRVMPCFVLLDRQELINQSERLNPISVLRSRGQLSSSPSPNKRRPIKSNPLKPSLNGEQRGLKDCFVDLCREQTRVVKSVSRMPFDDLSVLWSSANSPPRTRHQTFGSSSHQHQSVKRNLFQDFSVIVNNVNAEVEPEMDGPLRKKSKVVESGSIKRNIFQDLSLILKDINAEVEPEMDRSLKKRPNVIDSQISTRHGTKLVQQRQVKSSFSQIIGVAPADNRAQHGCALPECCVLLSRYDSLSAEGADVLGNGQTSSSCSKERKSRSCINVSDSNPSSSCSKQRSVSKPCDKEDIRTCLKACSVSLSMLHESEISWRRNIAESTCKDITRRMRTSLTSGDESEASRQRDTSQSTERTGRVRNRLSCGSLVSHQTDMSQSTHRTESVRNSLLSGDKCKISHLKDTSQSTERRRSVRKSLPSRDKSDVLYKKDTVQSTQKVGRVRKSLPSGSECQVSHQKDTFQSTQRTQRVRNQLSSEDGLDVSHQRDTSQSAQRTGSVRNSLPSGDESDVLYKKDTLQSKQKTKTVRNQLSSGDGCDFLHQRDVSHSTPRTESVRNILLSGDGLDVSHQKETSQSTHKDRKGRAGNQEHQSEVDDNSAAGWSVTMCNQKLILRKKSKRLIETTTLNGSEDEVKSSHNQVPIVHRKRLRKEKEEVEPHVHDVWVAPEHDRPITQTYIKRTASSSESLLESLPACASRKRSHVQVDTTRSSSEQSLMNLLTQFELQDCFVSLSRCKHGSVSVSRVKCAEIDTCHRQEEFLPPVRKIARRQSWKGATKNKKSVRDYVSPVVKSKISAAALLLEPVIENTDRPSIQTVGNASTSQSVENASMPTSKRGENASMPTSKRGENASMPTSKRGEKASMPTSKRGENASIPTSKRGENESIPTCKRDEKASMPTNKRDKKAGLNQRIENAGRPTSQSVENAGTNERVENIGTSQKVCIAASHYQEKLRDMQQANQTTSEKLNMDVELSNTEQSSTSPSKSKYVPEKKKPIKCDGNCTEEETRVAQVGFSSHEHSNASPSKFKLFLKKKNPQKRNRIGGKSTAESAVFRAELSSADNPDLAPTVMKPVSKEDKFCECESDNGICSEKNTIVPEDRIEPVQSGPGVVFKGEDFYVVQGKSDSEEEGEETLGVYQKKKY